ncbi:MAG: PadR family transcriptional regulator [Clostridiales bacterium]|jgi:DNA-binding PadR family transcriptional regulator|nr:PadR family transcriptional regulator [Clostridiales bacterium]
MSIASDLIRGNTDTIILANLLVEDSYGYKINKAINEKTNHYYELKEATLYTAFKRLEESGCITSYWGDEKGGARRRYYAITPLGKETYRMRKKGWETAKQIIDKLISDGGEQQ